MFLNFFLPVRSGQIPILSTPPKVHIFAVEAQILFLLFITLNCTTFGSTSLLYFATAISDGDYYYE